MPNDATPAAEDFGSNAWIVEEMYQRYQASPSSVSEAWRSYFEGAVDLPKAATGTITPLGAPDGDGQAAPPRAPAAEAPAAEPPAAAPPAETPTEPDAAEAAESAPVGAATAEPGAEPDTAAAAKPEPAPQAATQPAAPSNEDEEVLRGAAAVIAERMGASRELPTATSVRTFPAKLLEVNRRILNNQLGRRTDGGKVSFTHLIGWAVVGALREFPAMNAAYREIDGVPHRVAYQHINLGLAMDMPKRGGGRTLLVPNLKNVDEMTFREYWEAYEATVARVRAGTITPDDFAGTTATLTNPGTVGTAQSVPRLMPEQGVIIGVGRIGYPPEYEGSDPKTLAAGGVGRTVTMTSTYDHRIIQGAESGMFLGRIHELLLGVDEFYDEIFRSMRIPYVPARWAVDANPPPGSQQWAEKQARVFQLINIYRVRGHLIADLDPLRQKPPEIHPELDPLTYGLSIWDLEREFATGGLAGRTRMALGEILGLLRDAYCRTSGIEYMHIQEPDQKLWIQHHAEVPQEPFRNEERVRLLRKLTEAETFERFLHTKFLGAKRFSLEGAESFIPLLDGLLNTAADFGIEEVVFGMAHRGRLNVLANIVHKPLPAIFRDFIGHDDPEEDAGFSGDVKYHLGARGEHTTRDGRKISVEVVANPSHLEAVDPVLEGFTRAKQDARGTGADDVILPVLIHGDAAFSGQGVVAETLNLSQLRGYYTGGTVHVVVNNQVGFTTSARDARSSFYATDVAKAVQAPIFHVNGDDPEAVIRVAKMAFGFREAFHKDVVLDLVCYRRLGHNEGDEPTYTQPKMYKIIDQHPSVLEVYARRLVADDVLTEDEVDEIVAEYRSVLDEALAAARDVVPRPLEPPGSSTTPIVTKVSQTRLASIEEDSQRGTFSIATPCSSTTRRRRSTRRSSTSIPARRRSRSTTACCPSSPRWASSTGTRCGDPDALVLWEAQFGDFVNGAQVIIDQFIASGEDKWSQRSGPRAAAAPRLRGPGAGALQRAAGADSCSSARRSEHARGCARRTRSARRRLTDRAVLDPPAAVSTISGSSSEAKARPMLPSHTAIAATGRAMVAAAQNGSRVAGSNTPRWALRPSTSDHCRVGKRRFTGLVRKGWRYETTRSVLPSPLTSPRAAVVTSPIAKPATSTGAEGRASGGAASDHHSPARRTAGPAGRSQPTKRGRRSPCSARPTR
jgi:multifunctional 2-oxoglutarate metabolism enzyme